MLSLRAFKLTRFGLVFSLWLLMGFFGCKNDEAAKNGISGSVVVEGGSASGAIVEVYGSARTAVWTNNDLVSSLGFPYNHSAGFDWRISTPVTSVTVGADGRFEIPDLTDREYVIIARKSSFGWTAPRSTVLRGQPINVGTLTLFPETTLGRVSTGHDTLLTNHHYVLPNNFSINPDHVVTVQPGAVVRMQEGVRITVHGSLVATGTATQFITFTSDEQDTVTAGYWWNITVENSQTPPLFQYVTFTGCEQGVNSMSPNTTIESCYFRNVSIKAATFTGVGQPSYFIRNMVDNVPTGITALGIDSTEIEHNVFQTCSNFAVTLENADGGSIYCNGFFDCGKNDSLGNSGTIFLSYISGAEIYNNNIYRCFFALNTGSGIHADVVMHHNMISACYVAVLIGYTPNAVSASYPTLNNNCILGTSGRFYNILSCGYNNHDMDASNNYWDGRNSTYVNDRIYDCGEDPPCGCVNIQPILSGYPSGVGACTE